MNKLMKHGFLIMMTLTLIFGSKFPKPISAYRLAPNFMLGVLFLLIGLSGLCIMVYSQPD